ncbi:MAG: hypothetical protein JO008_21650, partial [Alphaproteobacteria bacterium]|nr:hypothetical protein [Alphaproteobacteria bacterium]
RRLAIAFVALALIAAAPALAQEAPPARVGRVAFVSGQLGFHLAGETAWSAAKANYPVATGGYFWTDPKSRAELRVGSRTIDLSGDTELDVTKLDQQVMQMAVPQGRIDLRVRTLLEGESIEIDLPRGAVWILQPGIYDIDASTADRPERIAVFEGSARLVGGTLDIAINAGDAAVVSGDQTLTASIEKAASDEFTKWCRSRDYDERRLAAAYYLSPQMTGYEELDEYGSWREVPQYGEVWFPGRVEAGWAPYREGHWVWLDPWGWSWVDDEPWGFAPFHYGRWAMVDDQWAWVPGEFVPQPVYAPALVAFVGDAGAGYWDAPDVGPAVGWFPLAPGEVYWPGYTRDVNYIRNINITNVSVTTINQVTLAAAANRAGGPSQLRDRTFANRAAATTIVPARVFANADPVAPAARQMPRQVVQQAAQQAPVRLNPPQVTPAFAGHRGSAAAVKGATPATAAGPAVGHAPGTPGFAHTPGTPVAPSSTAGPGAHVPPAATERELHGAPAIGHAPSAAEREAHPAAGIAHAPPTEATAAPQNTHQPAHPGRLEAAHEPPTAIPPAIHGPMRVGPAPQPAHATAPPVHELPPHMHAPRQIVHVAPPPAPHPAPAAAPQVLRGPPAAPPAPHPAPQVAHAPAPIAAPAARPAAQKGPPPKNAKPGQPEEKH